MHAQLKEFVADLYICECCASTPAAADSLKAVAARVEGEQLPEADYPAPRSLEALRLEDPAAMSGCWNPGCAVALTWRFGKEVSAPGFTYLLLNTDMCSFDYSTA